MELEYVKVASYYKKRKVVCPHNDWCECYTKDCSNCGWNPKVAKKRSEKILGKECK